MAGLFRRDRGANQPPHGGADPRTYQTQCPSCGLLNDGSARFCRNCGLPLGWPQDPVRGTTTRRAELPSERGSGLASIVGLLAALALLAGAAWFAFRPSGGGGTFVPPPSASAAASASPEATAGSTSTGSTLPPSQPIESTEPSVEPSSEASVEPTSPSGSFSPSTGFTCDQATLTDPTNGRWKITGTNALRNGIADEMTLTLSRAGDIKTGPTLTIESMTPSDVTARYGIIAPSSVDRAIVVSFEGKVSIGVPQAIPSTGLTAIVNTDAETDSTGVVRAVLGVNGTGCHQLSVPSWASDPAATTIQVLIDVKRH
jgi:hypothetical protein